jgi:hypothetical protein
MALSYLLLSFRSVTWVGHWNSPRLHTQSVLHTICKQDKFSGHLWVTHDILIGRESDDCWIIEGTRFRFGKETTSKRQAVEDRCHRRETKAHHPTQGERRHVAKWRRPIIVARTFIKWLSKLTGEQFLLFDVQDCQPSCLFSCAISTLVFCGVQEVKANTVMPHLHPEIEDRKHNNPMQRKTMSSLRKQYTEFNEKESSHL